MKSILALVFVLLSSTAFSQSKSKIDTLIFANKKIAVPENCKATSKYELFDCDGVSIQWSNSTKEMVEPMVNQLFSQYFDKESTKKQSDIIIEAFGSKLTGYNFKIRNDDAISYIIIVRGKVKKQYMIVNLTSQSEIKGNKDLSVFLQSFLEIN